MRIRFAHGCALLLAGIALFAFSASASANTITTVAGGGNLTPLDYEHFGYTDPLTQTLPSPSGIAWSGDPGGLYYVTAGEGKCVQLWHQPDASDTVNYGMAIEAGTYGNCGVQIGGYPKQAPDPEVPAKYVRLKNPCCVASNFDWDPNAATTGPLVASTDTGHVNFYSWKNNTGVTIAGSTAPADCNAVDLLPVGIEKNPDYPATSNEPLRQIDPPVLASAAQFCNVTALAQETSSPNFVVAERNRGTYAGILYLVNAFTEPDVVIPLSIGSLGARDFAGLAWHRGLLRVVASDGFSSIYALQPSGGSGWVIYRIAGPDFGGQNGFAGDGGPAINAKFANPNGLAMGFDNSVFVADTDNCRIRRISNDNPGGTATVDTVAGNGCSQGPLGDGGDATGANLDHPLGVAMAPQGLLITDTGHDRVRLVDRTTIVKDLDKTADNTPAFEIRSLDVPAHLKCEVDNVKYPCSAIGPLTDGKHTLEAWENGVAGGLPNPPDPTPAVDLFSVDTTAPTDVSLLSPAAGATGVASSPDFSWTPGTDAIAGIDHYELWIDGAKDSDVSKEACTADACTAKPAALLADGDRTWQIRTVDTLGNTAASEVRSLNTSGAPLAAFSISPNPALTGRSVTFDASASADGSGIARYEWDLDGDGAFETDAGGSATTSRVYDAPTTITVRLRVTDGTGAQAGAEQSLKVTQLPGQSLLGISINSGAQYTKDANVELLVNAPTTATQLLASNDGGFLAPTTFTPAKTIKWKLDSSGPERLPKTVYVRFRLGPIISETYTDDIILDEIPPVVKQATLAGAPAVRASASRSWSLRVRATDSNSGVSKVQVTANKRKPGKLLAYRSKLKVRSAARPKFLRAQDRAGNFSAWKKLR